MNSSVNKCRLTPFFLLTPFFSRGRIFKIEVQFSNTQFSIPFSMRSAHLHTVSHFVALIVLGLVARAEPPGSTEYWKQAVAKQTLPEIAALMVAGTNSSWPEVKSARQSTGVESAGKIALVKALREKMKQSFEEGDTSLQTVAAYSKISTRLQTSGGYGNILLADCFNRLVLFRVTGWLVEKSKPLNEVKAIYGAWNVPSAYDPNVWLKRFQDDDPVVKAARNNFNKIQPGIIFYPSIIGIRDTGIDALASNNQTFTHLMKQPSALILMWRFARTEISKVVSVQGFISFTEKGGKREELDPKDGGPFERRMGKEIEEIKYPPFDHHYLSLEDIQFCYDLHSDPKLKAYTLDAALK